MSTLSHTRNWISTILHELDKQLLVHGRRHFWQNANKVTRGNARCIAHGPAVIAKALEQRLEHAAPLRLQRRRRALLRQLGNTSTGGLAHGVIIGDDLGAVEVDKGRD